MGGNDYNYGSTFFYNQRSVIIGSVYLYDEWDNNAEIHTLTNERFLVKNINLNINVIRKSHKFITNYDSDITRTVLFISDTLIS